MHRSVARAALAAVLGIFLHVPAAGALTLDQSGYVVAPFTTVAVSAAGMDVDGAGNLYVAIGTGVTKITGAGVANPWSTSAASDLALEPAASGYGAGRAACHCIQSFTSGGAGSMLHQDENEWAYVALDPVGPLYASIWAGTGQGLYTIDKSTGQPAAIVTGGPAPDGSGIYFDMTMGSDGHLYVLGSLDGTVGGTRLFRLDGTAFTAVVTLPHGGNQLARGPDGAFYAGTSFDYGSGYPVGEVWILDPSSGDATLLAHTDPEPHIMFPLVSTLAYEPSAQKLYVVESTGKVSWIAKEEVPARTETWGTVKARYR